MQLLARKASFLLQDFQVLQDTVPLKDNAALARTLLIDTRLIDTCCSMYMLSNDSHFLVTDTLDRETLVYYS